MNRSALIGFAALIGLLLLSAAASHYATRYQHAAALAEASRHGAEAERARAESLALLSLERAARLRAEHALEAADREAGRADSLQALLDAGRYPAPTAAQLAAIAEGDVIPCGTAFVARCLFLDGDVLPATRAALDTLRRAYDVQSEHLSILAERAGLLLVEAEARADEADALRRALRTEPRSNWRARVELVGTAAHPPDGIELRAGVGVSVEHDRFRLSPAVELASSGHVVPSLRLAYALTP